MTSVQVKNEAVAIANTASSGVGAAVLGASAARNVPAVVASVKAASAAKDVASVAAKAGPIARLLSTVARGAAASPIPWLKAVGGGLIGALTLYDIYRNYIAGGSQRAGAAIAVGLGGDNPDETSSPTILTPGGQRVKVGSIKSETSTDLAYTLLALSDAGYTRSQFSSPPSIDVCLGLLAGAILKRGLNDSEFKKGMQYAAKYGDPLAATVATFAHPKMPIGLVTLAADIASEIRMGVLTAELAADVVESAPATAMVNAETKRLSEAKQRGIAAFLTAASAWLASPDFSEVQRKANPAYRAIDAAKSELKSQQISSESFPIIYNKIGLLDAHHGTSIKSATPEDEKKILQPLIFLIDLRIKITIAMKELAAAENALRAAPTPGTSQGDSVRRAQVERLVSVVKTARQEVTELYRELI